MQEENKNVQPKQNHDKKQLWWRFLRPMSIVLCSILIVSVGAYYICTSLYTAYIAPVDKNDPTPIEVEITSGWSLSKIAEALVEHDVIRNSGIFKYYVDFQGDSARLKSGKYTLNKTMSLDTIIDVLIAGDGRGETTRFTIPEGYNIQEIATHLYNKGILSDTKTFLSLCKEQDIYSSYDFIQDVPDASARRYVLEGYLFPSTYEIYVDADAETIIRKLLTQTQTIVYREQYAERMQELGMTIDEVYTLASIIEKEARTADMAKVSAVFHSRLKQDMPLQSCVTVQYVLGTKRLALTTEDTSVDSPYNTYKYKGLPIGPITNPGEAAIEAALYPDEEFMKQGYLYFGTKDPTSGELFFAKTYAEHQKYVDQYRPLWLEYDAQHS